MIANETRLKVYEHLIAHGPTTNNRLAEVVGAASGSLSYHLRKLQEIGFVEPLFNEADKRERIWRAVPGGLRWSANDEQQEPLAAAFGAAKNVVIDRRVQHMKDWAANGDLWDQGWREAALDEDIILHLTQDELSQLRHELTTVLDAWRARDPGAAAVGEDRAVIYVVQQAFPA